jgi:hypothetical protein
MQKQRSLRVRTDDTPDYKMKTKREEKGAKEGKREEKKDRHAR